MSYYENNSQWSAPGQNNWDHQGHSTRTGTSGPTSQDDFAFFYQFDEVDRAYENVAKSGKVYGMGGRREFSNSSATRNSAGSVRPPLNDGRAAPGAGPRSHTMNDFSDSRPHHQSNLQNFYASQRHQSPRGSNEAEQVMQAKRRMAAQRERELRNLHTEQQYQRNALSEVSYGPKAMSEEETRELIARQRSALYGEGPFAEKGGYVDETGNVRHGAPGHSGPASLRGTSPLAFEMGRGNAPGSADGTPASATDPSQQGQNPNQEQGSRPNSTASPQPNAGAGKGVFDNGVSQGGNRTSSSSPGGSPPRQELPGGPKPNQPAASVAPIGTRPSGAPGASTATKRSTTPLASPGGWGRGNGVWGQSSGLGAQASVWG